jgi:two-component system sensor histidine kinase PilS (NtrC family)
LPLEPDSAFARLWAGFMAARIAIAVALMMLMGVLSTLVPALNVSRWIVALSATYLAAALAVRLFTRPMPPGHSFDPQWVFTIGVDLVAFSALQYLQVAGFNYSPLFALPVLMAAVLGSALLALGTAAGVTLLLLSDAWVLALHAPGDEASRLLQAALTGTGYFALALVVNQLAARLEREELAAEHGRRAARVQAQVNALVIEALSEGVLIADRQGRVHAANPAARNLLGLGEGAEKISLDDHPASQPLRDLALLTFERGATQVAELALQAEPLPTRRVHVRTQLTAAGPQQAESLCVVFLQDLREMEARLRTEKLAAMGRMSTAVAHEIRNPLAAIAQANDLMEEDLRDPGLRQLSALVRKNTQRLSQIVEEILDISRVRPTGGPAPVLALDASVAAACGDWATQTRSASRIALALHSHGMHVRFDADHLRRVLVNLLDNALRYAGQMPDSIRVTTRVAAGAGPSLHVWSDGAPLDPSVEEHLFEPFFSSESRSTGLGLYICRELCERHGGGLAYARTFSGEAGRVREGNEFIVTFQPARGPLAGTASFDTIAA